MRAEPRKGRPRPLPKGQRGRESRPARRGPATDRPELSRGDQPPRPRAVEELLDPAQGEEARDRDEEARTGEGPGALGARGRGSSGCAGRRHRAAPIRPRPEKTHHAPGSPGHRHRHAHEAEREVPRARRPEVEARHSGAEQPAKMTVQSAIWLTRVKKNWNLWLHIRRSTRRSRLTARPPGARSEAPRRSGRPSLSGGRRRTATGTGSTRRAARSWTSSAVGATSSGVPLHYTWNPTLLLDTTSSV